MKLRDQHVRKRLDHQPVNPVGRSIEHAANVHLSARQQLSTRGEGALEALDRPRKTPLRRRLTRRFGRAAPAHPLGSPPPAGLDAAPLRAC